jgi:hypothetical protein
LLFSANKDNHELKNHLPNKPTQKPEILIMSILALTSDTLIGTPATGNIEYNGQFFGTDSNASRAQMQRIVRATAVASTSGTSIDFNSIPAWVKKITVMFYGVSTNGTARTMVQLGTSGGVTTSGYLGSSGSANFSTGIFTDDATSATVVRYAQVVITNITGNTWVATSNMGRSDSTTVFTSGGGIALSGTLDRIRITTSGGIDTFDAGTVNILYEG